MVTAFEAASSPTSAADPLNGESATIIVNTPQKQIEADDTMLLDDGGTPISVLSDESSTRRELFEEELRAHGLGADDSDDDLL